MLGRRALELFPWVPTGTPGLPCSPRVPVVHLTGTVERSTATHSVPRDVFFTVGHCGILQE